jgi:leucine efflux protein
MANIDWIGFIIASIAVVLSPGPGSLFVAKTAVTSGLRAAHGAMLGIMVGDTGLIVLSVLGVSALFREFPSLFHILRLAGASYLLFLGLKLIIGKSRTDSVRLQGHSFRQAISITLLNPKAVFFFMAFFPLFVRSPESDPLFTYAVMTLTFQFVSATYLSLLVRVSSWTSSALVKSSAVRFVLEKLCGCVFIGFGVKVALSRR